MLFQDERIRMMARQASQSSGADEGRILQVRHRRGQRPRSVARGHTSQSLCVRALLRCNARQCAGQWCTEARASVQAFALRHRATECCDVTRWYACCACSRGAQVRPPREGPGMTFDVRPNRSCNGRRTRCNRRCSSFAKSCKPSAMRLKAERLLPSARSCSTPGYGFRDCREGVSFLPRALDVAAAMRQMVRCEGSTTGAPFGNIVLLVTGHRPQHH